MAFNAQGLLDQVLGAGKQSMGQRRSARGPSGGSGLGGLARGAIASGALGMLLGKRRRGFGGGLAARGGTAVLGMLAYRAFKEWRAQQGQGDVEPRTLDRVSGSEADHQSQAVLRAVIGAAKADGHVDENERRLIDEEIAKSEDAPELRQWLSDELRKPIDPTEIASSADTPEVAAEMYLAARLMIDEQNRKEQAYLNELAGALRLDTSLRERLDRQAEEAGQSMH